MRTVFTRKVKGVRAMSFRATPEILEGVERLVDQLSEENPAMDVTCSDALRIAAQKGLEVLLSPGQKAKVESSVVDELKDVEARVKKELARRAQSTQIDHPF